MPAGRRLDLVRPAATLTIAFGVVWTAVVLGAFFGWRAWRGEAFAPPPPSSAATEQATAAPSADAPVATPRAAAPPSASAAARAADLANPTYLLFERAGPDRVLAVRAGTVDFAGEVAGLGGMVIVAHEGEIATTYSSLAEVLVAEGQQVAAGAPLGVVGPAAGTGAHVLRFEVALGEDVAAPALIFPDGAPERLLFAPPVSNAAPKNLE